MSCLPLWPAFLFLLTSNLASVLLVLVRFHDALLLRQYSTLLIWTFVRLVVLCRLRFVLVLRVLYMLCVDYSLILCHRQLFWWMHLMLLILLIEKLLCIASSDLCPTLAQINIATYQHPARLIIIPGSGAWPCMCPRGDPLAMAITPWLPTPLIRHLRPASDPARSFTGMVC